VCFVYLTWSVAVYGCRPGWRPGPRSLLPPDVHTPAVSSGAVALQQVITRFPISTSLKSSVGHARSHSLRHLQRAVASVRVALRDEGAETRPAAPVLPPALQAVSVLLALAPRLDCLSCTDTTCICVLIFYGPFFYFLPHLYSLLWIRRVNYRANISVISMYVPIKQRVIYNRFL